VNGTDAADGSPYAAIVAVMRNGDTSCATWVVGNNQHDGTGIGDKNFLAVCDRSGDVTGFAVYGAKGDSWESAYAGRLRLGTEIWQRR